MQDIKQILINALIELQSISKTVNDDCSFKSAANKYGILFLGTATKIITTVDVKNFLLKTHNVSLDINSINAIMPTICEQLNIKCTPSHKLTNIGNDQVDAYTLTL